MPTPRMLIADDNPVSLRFLSDALAVLGVEHASAADGSQALAAAQRDAFGLLLLDARMPGHSGVQVLALLRAHPGPSQHATALATTADNTPATHTALRDAGFSDVLLKPLSIDRLRSALAHHLQLSSDAPAVDDGAAQEEPCPAADPGLIQPLDDRHALAAVGGDAAIVAALRALFAAELDALPAELAPIIARRDAGALHERLHRLDASAGFCGAPALQRAASVLRVALDAPVWPNAAMADFLGICAQVRAALTAER